MKRRIVLSGVSLRESGSLVVFRDALTSLEEEYGDKYEIVALVKSRELFDTPRVTYIEFPRIISSWVARLRFEYWSLRRLSEYLKPHLWLSMHDTTPNVQADIHAVYCHNMSEFYRVTPSEFLLDFRFGMFTLCFRCIHRINLHRNQYVIVQGNWIRKSFARIYGIHNIVVAPPEVLAVKPPREAVARDNSQPYRLFYPAYPRPYKNFDVCLKAAQILERRGIRGFEIWITSEASINRYAAHVVNTYPDVRSVRWLGLLPRERVIELYGQADCLLFPSRLESRGLPISEFRCFGKPMLLADMPYAHESATGHPQTCFFDPRKAGQLASLIERAARGEPIFNQVAEANIDEPYARSWSELWGILLSAGKH